MVDFAKLRESLERARNAWHRRPFVAIDIETTGLDPFADRIIELGLARFEQGRCVWHGSRYVHPERDPRFIDLKLLKLTHIDPRNLMEARPFWAVWNELAPVLDGAWPVAFYGSFDRAFIGYHVARSWPRAAFQVLPSPIDPQIRWVDACSLARQFLPGLYGYRLGDVVRTCGLPKREKHTAEDDAISAGEIVQFFVRAHANQMDDIERVFKIQREATAIASIEKAHIKAQKHLPKEQRTDPSFGRYHTVECDVCHKIEPCQQPLVSPLPENWRVPNNTTLTTCGPACEIVAGWFSNAG